MNPSPVNITPANSQSAQPGPGPGSATWINKLKIVGRGQNWAVAPYEPFYLMGTEPPASDAALTGAKNLIEHYGLENAYLKFCGKRLREELSAFLPHLCGNIDVPASADGSGLMALIERPPIRGKELRPFAPGQLDHAFRLHPGPLPQEYAALFAAAPPKPNPTNAQDLTPSGSSINATNGSRIPASAAPGLIGPGGFPRRRRRYEVHRGALATSGSGSSIGPPGGGGGGSSSGSTTTPLTSFFPAPPSCALAQLGSSHTNVSLSSSLPTQPSGHPTSSGSMHNPNIAAPPHSTEPAISSNASKSADLPPGLIPVTAPQLPSTISSETPPPPPPLLAPIHQSSGQRLTPSISNPMPPITAGPNSNMDSISNRQTLPAPPLLHSIHNSSVAPIGSSSTQSHGYPNLHSSQSYPNLKPPMRSLSPNALSSSSTSSPPPPDLYKIRRSDLSEEERRKKKRKEKKKRKDKEI